VFHFQTTWWLAGVALLGTPTPALGKAAAASCDPIVTFADGKQPARSIYVSPTGSDSSGTGTRESPFRTLPRAAQGVQPGTALRLLPGTHPPGTYLSDLAGTADAPIWIGGVPGETRPVIAGGNQALHLVRVRHIVVENLVVRDAAQNGINCDDGGETGNPEATRHVILRNLSFHDIGTGGNQDALKLSGVDDYFVLDCAFSRTSAGGSGIDHVGCHAGLIARCTFEDMGSNAIQCKGGSADIEVRWNRFVRGGQRAINIGGSTGFAFFRPPLTETGANTESRNIRVLANVFEGSEAPVAFVGTVGSIVANNTIIDPTRWVMRILQETTSRDGFTFLPCGDNRFVNNLVWFDHSRLSTFVNVGPNTAPATFAFANNLWYAHSDPARSQPGLPAAETGGLVGRDPLLRDPAASDYRLPPDSPAAGVGLGLPLMLHADLLERCYASPPSIGAFEANPLDFRDADGDDLPDDWEERHSLDNSTPADRDLDPDQDGATSFAEYIAGTHPRDAQSVFRLSLTRAPGIGVNLVLPSVLEREYRIEIADWPSADDWNWSWEELATERGNGGPLTRTVPMTAGSGAVFRASVRPARN
jgi:hypothetical protein